MTEEEALTKWCPFVRVVAETDRTHPMTNREEVVGDRLQGAVSRCLGAACMAWRWGQKPNPDWKHGGMAMSWEHPALQPPAHIRDTTQGGCGLAGTPQ